MAHRTRSRCAGSDSRRRFLFRICAGTAALLGMGVAARETRAYTSVTGGRTSSVGAAAQGDGIVGIVDHGPVKKNNREAMVEITNNAAASVSYTVTLDTCTDGTLYDNEGGSGCSVTFSLASGNSRFVDIEASVTGFIGYSISASGDGLSLATTGTVESQSGNVVTAVIVDAPTKDKEFNAAPPQGNQGNEFEVKKVDVRDGDGDNDLVEVKFEVRESGGSGDVVGEKTVSFDPPIERYNPKGNPPELIQPDDGYTIQSGQVYELRVNGTDEDGNVDTSIVEDTA